MDQGQSQAIQWIELRSSQHLAVVAIEKGAFGSPSNMFTNFTYKSYIYLMYTDDLALNYQQWLLCHKTKPNYICIKMVEAYICNPILS